MIINAKTNLGRSYSKIRVVAMKKIVLFFKKTEFYRKKTFDYYRHSFVDVVVAKLNKN